MDQQTLLMAALGCIAVIGVAIAAFPSFFNDDRVDQRRKTIVAAPTRRASTERVVDQAARRKQIADSLKEVENRNRSKRLTIETRLSQAGVTWTKSRYLITSAAAGVGLAVVSFIVEQSFLISGLLLLIGGLGLPRWVLNYLRGRRLKMFRLAFPDALDIIIRGVKAGLPLGDCLRMIGNEAQEPVRSEFKQITQSTAIGIPIGEACDRMAERVPIPEASFFSIVINIQQKAGGNLSEALANLSRVLRDRKKMQGKIKAMSQEAKASAMIIGALPFAVGFLVWLTSPRYIELLWLTTTGRWVMVGCLFWMSIGIAVIKKMISFNF